MRQGKLVFAQLSEHLPRSVFLSFAARYAGRYPTLSFTHWDQFLCMIKPVGWQGVWILVGSNLLVER
jgi:hypothetical protein